MASKKSADTPPPAPPRTETPLSAAPGNGGGSAAASTPADARPSANFRYVDRPECPETFADAITAVAFDGQTLRLEFAVSRVDEVKANMPITGRRYPACRLVLPPNAAIDLINKMQQVAAALTQAGMLKAAQKPAEPAKG